MDILITLLLIVVRLDRPHALWRGVGGDGAVFLAPGG